MFQSKARTVAEYVASLPPDRQAVVRKIRSFVKKHLPTGYKEQIEFGAIAYAVPLAKLPDTYNRQPLCYAAIAPQKNYYTLYLMNVYGDPKQKKWMADEFKKRGKKFDMGKSCLHFKSLDDLPLDIVGQVIASTPMDDYIERYRLARRSLGGGGKKTAKGKQMIALLLLSFLLQPFDMLRAAPSFVEGQTQPSAAPPLPQATEGDFVIKDFRFSSGETLPELRIHYRTLGAPRKNAQGVVTNAVLIMHGTGGSGAQFGGRGFAGELFLPGQPLDVTKYYAIMPDDIGHGRSSKPSDGLRAKFPRYGYHDMLTAEYRLLTEGLGVNHLRLVMGTSMGGMHTWLWGQRWPEFMDALMPLASVPGQISGRNRVWRRVVIDAIRNDPEWQGGNYTKQPQSARTAAQMLWLVSSNPVIRHRRAPTLAQADKEIDDYVANWLRNGDVNDQLYALESSFDYDPGPGLEKITAPLLAINSADDLVNPPEIGLLEQEIKRVPKGRFVMIPLSDRTAGHGTHTAAAVWKSYLVELLKGTSRPDL